MARKKLRAQVEDLDLREGAVLTGIQGIDDVLIDEKSLRKPGKAVAETPTAKVTARGRDNRDSLADRGPGESAAYSKRLLVIEVDVPQARSLITTTPNAHEEILDGSSGAIVRIKAQVGDTDGDISRAKAALELVAERVVVVPAPKSAAPIPEQVARPTAQTAREAVLALVEEGAFHDKPALRDLVEVLLAEHGL